MNNLNINKTYYLKDYYKYHPCQQNIQIRACNPQPLHSSSGHEESNNGGVNWPNCLAYSCLSQYSNIAGSCVLTNQIESCTITNGQGNAGGNSDYGTGGGTAPGGGGGYGGAGGSGVVIIRYRTP